MTLPTIYRGILLVVLVTADYPVNAEVVQIRHEDGRLIMTVDDQPVATYVYADRRIPRPYFAHVRAPSGHQVTRNHPPRTGIDRTDHAHLHPGIWLAFGDLSGNDFWRNQASIVHQSFPEPPTGGDGRGRFVEQKHYLGTDQTLLCRERFVCEFRVLRGGYLLLWDSTLVADQTFHFGDQEEMGLGVRLATPLAEIAGGYLTDAGGRRGADAIWSQAAAWCDYRGTLDDVELGVTLLAHPENFRSSWWHARDYGFVAANPFGRRAMNRGEISQVVVEPGQQLRLRFGVWLHSQPAASPPRPPEPAHVVREINAIYQHYLRLAGTGP